MFIELKNLLLADPNLDRIVEFFRLNRIPDYDELIASTGMNHSQINEKRFKSNHSNPIVKILTTGLVHVDNCDDFGCEYLIDLDNKYFEVIDLTLRSVDYYRGYEILRKEGSSFRFARLVSDSLFRKVKAREIKLVHEGSEWQTYDSFDIKISLAEIGGFDFQYKKNLFLYMYFIFICICTLFYI